VVKGKVKNLFITVLWQLQLLPIKDGMPYQFAKAEIRKIG